MMLNENKINKKKRREQGMIVNTPSSERFIAH